ncbi:MAG: DNA polymerase III subunit beta [Patescibacteria group bacterium]|nr:DNA polymerase III subunit beta [Patescibacteria group bacterium]MDD5490942.1 DNA polymerase III subunit beta [Patescibacteria group bacterium]
MKLSCTQENLNQGLFVVGHIASKNTNLPILGNVLIEAKEGGVKLRATNLEIGVSCIIRGKVDEEGEFTVQSKVFSDYIALLPKEKVDLTLEDQELIVSCDNYHTKIKGVPAVDFPLIPQIDKKNPIICGVRELKEALAQVGFAVSLSNTRPEIGGIFFKVNDSQLILAATDSYRLAEKKIKLKQGLNTENSVIIPSKTIQELSRILGGLKKEGEEESEDNVEIYFGENQILFVYNGVEIISRLIEGQYPDYNQIVPKDFKTECFVGVADVANAVKTASLFARSGIYDVTLNFNPADDNVEVSAVNNQLGENKAKVVAKITGADNKIVLNYRYLLDGLNNLGKEEAKMELIDADNPCIIRPANTEGYLYIVMPIKQ